MADKVGGQWYYVGGSGSLVHFFMLRGHGISSDSPVKAACGGKFQLGNPCKRPEARCKECLEKSREHFDKY